jgi:dipeptide/tripeptide permease
MRDLTLARGSAVKRHPRKAFLVVFFIEIWERFGFYGMASPLVLYMVERLSLPNARLTLSGEHFPP